MNNANLPIRQCSAVFLYTPDGRFLLAEKNRPKFSWQLAQGGVEEGESHANAAIRETEEELGLKLKNVTDSGLTYTYEWPKEQQEKRGFWGQEVHFFLAPLPLDQEIKYNPDTPEEPQNSQLVTLNEAEKMLANPPYFEIIKQLYAQANQAQ